VVQVGLLPEGRIGTDQDRVGVAGIGVVDGGRPATDGDNREHGARDGDRPAASARPPRIG